MSRKDVGSRRLNLGAALATGAGALSRLVRNAVGAIVLCELVWLVPMGWPVEGWSAALWVLCAGLATLVAAGALARLSIHDGKGRPQDLGPLGLQMGKPEARLLGALLLCLLFLTMILSILALVVLAIFGMAELNVEAIQARDWAGVGAPWKLGVLAVVGLGALAIPLLLLVRLSLFASATIGRRQMVSLNSMGIAYGSFWPLLAGLIVSAVPGIVLAVLLGTGTVASDAAYAAAVIGLVGIQLPLTLGFLGAAYRQLEYWSPDDQK